MGRTVSCSYTFQVAQDDDLPQLARPAHVSEQAWRLCLSAYQTALARYQSAVTANSEQMRDGALPTSDHEYEERLAYDDLATARAMLLDLCKHPNELH